MRGARPAPMIVVIVSFAIALLSLAMAPAAAQNVTNSNTGQTYPTIQEAVDDAGSDDILELSRGVFVERVVINRSIDLVGAGTGETVIDGGGNGTCIQATGWNFWTLENVTVTNGTIGMYLNGTSGYVRNCRFDDFTDNGSSALVLERSWINITDCMISDNYRGIFARNDSYVECSTSTLVRNRGTWPGETTTGNGIYVEDSLATIWRCNISFNRPHAILIKFDSTVYIAENEMIGNHEDAVNFENCTMNTGIVRDNTISGSGNLGILVEYGSWDIDLTIEGNLIEDSGSSSGWGSGIGLQDSSGVRISNNTVEGSREAGIDLWNANAVVLTGNEVSGNVHGIWCRDAWFVDVIGCKVRGNDENGVLIEDSGYVDVNRSAVSGNSAGITTDTSHQVTVRECNVAGNSVHGLVALPSTIGNVTATHNWWGSADGPGGEGPGQGDNVTGNVTYDPWLGSRYTDATNEPPTAEIDSIYVPPPGKGETVFFSGHGDDSDGEVVAYRWRSNVTGVLSRNASFNSTNMTLGEHRIYFSVMDDNGTWSDEDHMDIVVEEHCSDCGGTDDEDDDEDTTVPESSIAVTVAFVVVILTTTIWYTFTRGDRV